VTAADPTPLVDPRTYVGGVPYGLMATLREVKRLPSR
jgi:hypothetical protein